MAGTWHTLKLRDHWRVPGISFQPLHKDLVQLGGPGTGMKDDQTCWTRSPHTGERLTQAALIEGEQEVPMAPALGPHLLTCLSVSSVHNP